VQSLASAMANFHVFALFTSLCLYASQIERVAGANDSRPSDESALMNIWNYQIERKIKTSIKYKMQDLAVWEEIDTAGSSPTSRRYYVTPPATLIPNSAVCKYVAITNSYEVTYDIQLWEKDLPSAVVAGLKELSLDIREDQIHALPFYQARIIWNNPEQELNDLKLTSAWVNNLKQQQSYSFRVAAANNASCNLLAQTIRTSPDEFVESIQLQFTVSAAKIDSRVINVKSEHVSSSQLVASLKNMPGADGPIRRLTSNDYNKMLWQISNQVLVSEVTSGDYVNADDELSLKDVVAQMFQTQKENTAQFDDKMWNSVFWDPLNERPDKITDELNHAIFINQTDHRAYRTQSGSSGWSAKVSGLISKLFGAEGSDSSSSSLTTDELSHFLQTSDIESQIKGEKFVPKQLDLTRLNVNDLSRQDLFATKRIKVRQVDIGGVLQIGIGNANKDQLDDENRYLRQQLTDIQSAYQQLTNASLSQQESIQALQANAVSLSSDVGALQNQTKNFHVYNCQTISLPNPPNCGQVGIAFNCPQGTFLISAYYGWTGDIGLSCSSMFIKSYTCC
jgi:hypothetical protein